MQQPRHFANVRVDQSEPCKQMPCALSNAPEMWCRSYNTWSIFAKRLLLEQRAWNRINLSGDLGGPTNEIKAAWLRESRNTLWIYINNKNYYYLCICIYIYSYIYIWWLWYWELYLYLYTHFCIISARYQGAAPNLILQDSKSGSKKMWKPMKESCSFLEGHVEGHQLLGEHYADLYQGCCCGSLRRSSPRGADWMEWLCRR